MSSVAMSPVAQSTLIGCALGASRVTAKDAVPEASMALASAIETEGATASPSTIVPVAIPSPTMAYATLLSITAKTSLCSSSMSSITVTVTIISVSPGANSTVPLPDV